MSPERNDDNHASGEEEPQARSSANVKHRRGLRRNAAACERCRKRKQKCDGKLPKCANCAASGNQCIPSQRLMVWTDPNCNCIALREQVRTLEAKIALLEQRESSLANTVPAFDSNPNGTERPFQAPSQGQPSPLERSYTGRILLPTFPQTATSDYPEQGLLSSPWHLWGSTLDEQGPQPGDDVPSSSEEASELVAIFFARRWPQLPVLHKNTFLQDHFTPTCHGLSAKPLSKFLVNMVLAIGAVEKTGTYTGDRVTHARYFNMATSEIGAVLADNDLNCIQALLLLVMYGINEPQSVNLWYTIGLALRLAVGIDMHRQDAGPGPDLFQSEMRKRVWWCVYIMDRSISMALGRPLGIQDSDVTTPLPQPISDEQLATTLSMHSTPSVISDVSDISSLIHTVKLRRLNAMKYSTFHAAGQTGLEDSGTLDNIRQQHYVRLTDWLANAPRYLNPTSMFQTSEWFQIAYHQAVITLYRPSNACPTTALEAIRLCVDSSISLITCYSTLYAKNKISYSFVALNSLFMAAVTMLHSLRASWILRQELTKQVVEHNVRLVTSLLREVSAGRTVGEHSARIIERLGRGALAIFDDAPTSNGEVDTEFLSWFGLKCQNLHQPDQQTPSIDTAWNDLIVNGFDMTGSGWTDLLV